MIFYVDSQMATVTDGLSQTKDGVDQIHDGRSKHRKSLDLLTLLMLTKWLMVPRSFKTV